jgi:hypothetical protein
MSVKEARGGHRPHGGFGRDLPRFPWVPFTLRSPPAQLGMSANALVIDEVVDSTGCKAFTCDVYINTYTIHRRRMERVPRRLVQRLRLLTIRKETGQRSLQDPDNRKTSVSTLLHLVDKGFALCGRGSLTIRRMARTTSSTTRMTRQAAKEASGNGTAGRKRRSGTRAMSDEHKQALATGRREGAAVKAYLEVLQTSKPKRGRRRSPEGVERRLAEITDALSAAAPLNRLLLTQERHDLEAELQRLRSGDQPNLQALEDAFAAYAASFAERKRIDYQTWRDMGVPDSVLKRAGIQRSARKRTSPAEPAEGAPAPRSRRTGTKTDGVPAAKPARRRTRTSAGK